VTPLGAAVRSAGYAVAVLIVLLVTGLPLLRVLAR
jgi:hypothetical protein